MIPLLLALASAEEPLPDYIDLLPDTPSFSTAKRRMYNKVYSDHQTTFYCDCTYASKVPDLASCGMEEADLGSRAGRTEAEHVVPASAFGRTRDCWAAGGRKHCSDVDPVYKTFESDLHNLVPAVGEINGDRSDFSMGLLDGEHHAYGACDFEVSTDDDMVEPAPAVRGDIARVYFYVAWQYGLPLTEGERRLFLAWHRADPVDAWEIERNQRIEGLQGNSNPFIH